MYTIISATTVPGLANKVNKMIIKGYMPVGGVSTTTDGWFIQALIKREKE